MEHTRFSTLSNRLEHEHHWPPGPSWPSPYPRQSASLTRSRPSSPSGSVPSRAKRITTANITQRPRIRLPGPSWPSPYPRQSASLTCSRPSSPSGSVRSRAKRITTANITQRPRIRLYGIVNVNGRLHRFPVRLTRIPTSPRRCRADSGVTPANHC
jgi:hypothetical protein